MEMKMKQLISSIVSVCMLMPFSAAAPFDIPVVRFCENSEYTNGSAFQSNLNQVLESLVGNVSTSGFNTLSGQNNHSTVYGFAQCRGDLNSSDCKQCVATAKAAIISGTSNESRIIGECNKTSASIILDAYLLRYDNHSFSNNFSESLEKNLMCNGGTNSEPKFRIIVKDLLQNTSYKAAKSPNLFAVEQDIAFYTLAQCWRDLSTKDCEACLQFSLSTITKNCTAGALGSNFGSVNCYMRYELYPFFNPPIISSWPLPASSPSPTESPPVSKAKGSNVQLRVILGVAAATIGLIATIILCNLKFFSRRKIWDHIFQMRGLEIVDDSVTN